MAVPLHTLAQVGGFRPKKTTPSGGGGEISALAKQPTFWPRSVTITSLLPAHRFTQGNVVPLLVPGPPCHWMLNGPTPLVTVTFTAPSHAPLQLTPNVL